MIVFRCLRCNEQLETPGSLSGETIECPRCRNINQVPAHASVAAVAAPFWGGNTPSRCSRLVYILLGIFLGPLGIHNFVAGYTSRGVIQLCITILTGWLIAPIFLVWIWVIIDIVTTTSDADGVPLSN